MSPVTVADTATVIDWPSPHTGPSTRPSMTRSSALWTSPRTTMLWPTSPTRTLSHTERMSAAARGAIMALHETDVLRIGVRFSRVARDASRHHVGAPGGLLQKAIGPGRNHVCGGARSGVVLRVDRRHTPARRRPLLHDPVHAASAAERVEHRQHGARGSAHETRT